MNATTRFLGSEADWAKATMTLHDIQGLWGGLAVTITGLGRVDVEQHGPALRDGQFTGTLPEAEALSLLRLFIEHDFLTLAIPFRPGIPDEAHPLLTLTNARGEAHVVGKWARQAEARFDALAGALRAAATRLRPA